MGKTWFSTGEVAELVGKSPRSIRRECEQPNGHFRGARFDDRARRVPAADLEEYEAFCQRVTARVRRRRAPSGTAPTIDVE